MMNFLYKDGLLGEGLFSSLLDSYSHSENAAKAIVNRCSYLCDKISLFIREGKGRGNSSISVASIGSGPGKEIQQLIQESDILNGCKLSLIDFDSESLLYAQEKILRLKIEYKRCFDITFIQKSVTNVLTGGFPFKDQDLIYAVGLCDYLEDSLSKALIAKLYESIRSGGVLIIGNMDPSNQTRFYIEYVMDWYLIYRTMEDLIGLASGLVPEPIVSVECEATKTNNFMVIRKP